MRLRVGNGTYLSFDISGGILIYMMRCILLPNYLKFGQHSSTDDDFDPDDSVECDEDAYGLAEGDALEVEALDEDENVSDLNASNDNTLSV